MAILSIFDVTQFRKRFKSSLTRPHCFRQIDVKSLWIVEWTNTNKQK